MVRCYVIRREHEQGRDGWMEVIFDEEKGFAVNCKVFCFIDSCFFINVFLFLLVYLQLNPSTIITLQSVPVFHSIMFRRRHLAASVLASL